MKPTPVKLEALRPVPSDMFTAGHPPNERVARGKTFTAPSRQVADDLIGAGYAREPKG